MGTWPESRIWAPPMLSVHSPECLGSHLAAIEEGGSVNTGYPAANRAIFLPFTLWRTEIVTKIVIVPGATPSGNVDVGLYDIAGTRLVSSGSTVKGAAATPQALDIADTILGPGLFYMAIAQDGTTQLLAQSPAAVLSLQGWGMAQQATAFPLPATATFATISTAFIPTMGALLAPRTVV